MGSGEADRFVRFRASRVILIATAEKQLSAKIGVDVSGCAVIRR
jgi:hypothetical protein